MYNIERKVLITGAAGFIGSSLVRQCVKTATEVIGVDNLINGKQANVADVVTDNFTFHKADIRDEEAMRTLLQGVDRVYHLACLGVRHSIHNPTENHDVNATATLSLLRLAHEAGVKRFVYVSSSEVYGTAMQVPMTENHPTYPKTVYGASKLAGESYTRAFYDTYSMETVVVRPFNAYGPRSHHEGDSGEVIPKFMLRAMTGKPLVIFGDGTQTRDFTYVSDTARGIYLAGVNDDVVGQTLNLGSNFEVSIRDLANIVANVVDKSVTIQYEDERPGDVWRLFADASAAGRLLGFEPQVTLEDGLQRLQAWYNTQDASPESLLDEERVRNWEKPNA